MATPVSDSSKSQKNEDKKHNFVMRHGIVNAFVGAFFAFLFSGVYFVLQQSELSASREVSSNLRDNAVVRIDYERERDEATRILISSYQDFLSDSKSFIQTANQIPDSVKKACQHLSKKYYNEGEFKSNSEVFKSKILGFETSVGNLLELLTTYVSITNGGDKLFKNIPNLERRVVTEDEWKSFQTFKNDVSNVSKNSKTQVAGILKMIDAYEKRLSSCETALKPLFEKSYVIEKLKKLP